MNRLIVCKSGGEDVFMEFPLFRESLNPAQLWKKSVEKKYGCDINVAGITF